jgi:hypothetical protein
MRLVLLSLDQGGRPFPNLVYAADPAHLLMRPDPVAPAILQRREATNSGNMP